MFAYSASLLFLYRIAREDIREKEIPSRILLIFAFLGMVFLLVNKEMTFESVLFRIMPGLFLLLIAYLSEEKIGYGDGLTILILGLWTGGVFTVIAMEIALALAGVYGLLKRISDKAERTIPFIPFLLIGMVVTLGFV